MASQVSIPKGTRDFSPTEMVRRNYIFNTISQIFRRYGYQQIETPAMEKLSTLTGKYGEEGDKLLFKILNSGDFLSKTDRAKLPEIASQALTPKISEKGLRYDLTVPFARYVVQHRNDIQFPFKRYQIQPVWRADRPQKGRYREFFQCDIDVIGSSSLLNELELVQVINDVFKSLKISTITRLNNRKILSGIIEYSGEKQRATDIIVAIDKLDKIGVEGVNREMASKGVSAEAISKLQAVLELSGTNIEKISQLKEILKSSETALAGIQEIETVFDYLSSLELQTQVELDLTLARGLNYYTGAIFEVSAKNVKIGSICGGGRYDNLTGIFGLKDVSGVGVSFGADRIYDVLNELKLFPQELERTSEVLFLNFGEKEAKFCVPILNKLRQAGISAEIFPDSVKIKKQMNYANKKNINFVLMIGESEMQTGKVRMKRMDTGKQLDIQIDKMVEALQV